MGTICPSFMSRDDYETAISLVREIVKFEQRIEKFILKREQIEFEIFLEQETNQWVVITEMCNIGGCSINYYEFNTEEEALRKAAELTILGEKIICERACSECYLEYIQDVE
ncbi:hypothetical protein AM501_09910 [Aneurinibacillus migulanus]|uniref:hypothetical protein n=1 Tax=Aneurinibacillus migulanus TaxID=47500 RepID=UPI0005BA0AAF|nr:hypothetical protein [Aneurinibacillus migulanus]KIV56459.1 hypothetical protein TS64_09325 [Aneurinibacillus migulanus]KPD08467.1 hypothetical protein AM501_09910 [Aneurinibacillus migulanus]